MQSALRLQDAQAALHQQALLCGIDPAREHLRLHGAPPRLLQQLFRLHLWRGDRLQHIFPQDRRLQPQRIRIAGGPDSLFHDHFITILLGNATVSP